MGCDIHLFTERKRKINGVKKWTSCDHFKINHYAENNEMKMEVVNIYSGRDYRLFSMLANVRNSECNNFICEPKGIPDDCSETVKINADYWDSDGHSHSFFTMKELKEFRSTNLITKYSGMMTPDQAEKVDRGEMPDVWCKWTNQKHYVYREWEHESDTLKTLIEVFEERIRDEMWIFNNGSTEKFDEDFRIVFWFDN